LSIHKILFRNPISNKIHAVVHIAVTFEKVVAKIAYLSIKICKIWWGFALTPSPEKNYVLFSTKLFKIIFLEVELNVLLTMGIFFLESW